MQPSRKRLLLIVAIVLLLIIIAIIIYFTTRTREPKKFYLNKGSDNGAFITGGYQPGDTLVLSSSKNPWSYIFCSASGDSLRHLVIINEGEVHMTAGFDLQGKFLDVIGDTAGGKFGFNVHRASGASISISGLAQNIHVRGIRVDTAQVFAWIKNEPACGAATNTWVLRNIEIDHFSAKHIALEGVYCGSTNVMKDSTQNVRPIYCNGVLTPIPPPRIGKLKIHDGLFDGTGRGAVQASFVSEDTAEFYNLTIRNVGREYDDAQGNGVNLGSFTKAKVWNCTISNTYVAGICQFGTYLKAWNNRIDSSGYLDGRKTAWAWNVWVDTRQSVGYEKPYFEIFNNTVGAHGNANHDMGIYDQVGQGYQPANILWNNKRLDGSPAVADVGPGIEVITKPPPTPPGKVVLKTVILYTDSTYSLQ